MLVNYNCDDAILFLVFNRVGPTSKVFEAIKQVAPKRLYVAADGPRNVEELAKCNAVREIATAITWDCELKTLFREENLGCRDAVSGAINWFFCHEDQGIILEDDCLPSTEFFTFCSVLLERYKHDDRVAHIGGSNFQAGVKRGEASYYFTRLPHIWGWASWRRAWKDYDVNMTSFPHFSVSDLENLPSHAPFKNDWYMNFKNTYDKVINTWDYQYSYFTIVHNYLSITPNYNLIKNIGFGADATHTLEDEHVFANQDFDSLGFITHPLFLIPDVKADLYTQERSRYQPPEKRKNFFSRTWKKIKGR